MNLCVSLKENSFKDFFYKIQGEDFVEIRLDDATLSDEEIKTLFSNKNKIETIATCRKSLYNDFERKEILLKAISAGANYVDIEIESDDSFKDDIIKLAQKKKCKIIISYHNFELTPKKEELHKIINDCTQLSPNIIIKIACKVNCIDDQNLLLFLYQNKIVENELLVIGMGEKGVLSRVSSLDRSQ